MSQNEVDSKTNPVKMCHVVELAEFCCREKQTNTKPVQYTFTECSMWESTNGSKQDMDRLVQQSCNLEVLWLMAPYPDTCKECMITEIAEQMAQFKLN